MDQNYTYITLVHRRKQKFILRKICILVWQIKFDISTEFLVGIVGFIGPVKGTNNFEALRSITFYTNNGRSGPYGDEIGHAFTSNVAAGKVVGFYLDAIGVHME